MKYSLSIVIPVYKNTESFLNFLSHNKKFFGDAEIIISNDNPQEKIKDRIKRVMEKAVVLETTKNIGFSNNVNKGVREARGEYILLLNSDVKLTDKSYEKSFLLFEKRPDLFAVSFAQKEKNGDVVGANTETYKEGLINHKGRSVTGVHPNFWAEGGSMIFRKKIFDELNGLDPLFSPFYWEDIDLSYRARKKGYEILFDSSILVEHHHGATNKAHFQKKFIERISYRNQFIFHWKNLTDATFIKKHLMFLPIHLMRALKDKNRPMILGFFDALLRLPSIIKKRNIKGIKKTDAQIFSLFSHET